MKEENISYIQSWVERLNSLKSIKRELAKPLSVREIQDYYSLNGFLYRWYHSKEGAMHLPIKFNESEKHIDKLQYQINYVKQFICNEKTSMVLELGCGMGYNSIMLAHQYPEVRFHGLDLTDENLKVARKNSTQLTNLEFKKGDFNNLELNEQYDLIFAVETLCYSIDINSTIKQALTLLKPGGKIIIFDVYETEALSQSSELIREAYRWHTWGFALDKYNNWSDLYDYFQITVIEDFSKHVLSNLKAYRKGSVDALSWFGLVKLLLRLGILPLRIFGHIVAGLFIYDLVAKGLLAYKLAVIEKPQPVS